MYASELLPPTATTATTATVAVLSRSPSPATSPRGAYRGGAGGAGGASPLRGGDLYDNSGGGTSSAASPALALAVRSAYRSACPQVLEVLVEEGLPALQVLEQV